MISIEMRSGKINIRGFLQCMVGCFHHRSGIVGENKLELGSSLFNLLDVLLIFRYHDVYLGVDIGIVLAYVTNATPFERIVSLDSGWMT